MASILVVDDEEDIRRLLSLALRRVGYQVSTAGDPRQALDILRDSFYELVVTDLRMPGMNGLDLLRRISERHPLTKGIVLTGYGSIQSAVEATKLGADNYLTKPIVIEEFLQIVRTTLERGQPLRAAPAPTLEVSTLAALTRLLAQPSLELPEMAQGCVDVVASMLGGHVHLSIVDTGTGLPLLEVQKGDRHGLPPSPIEVPEAETHLLAATLMPGAARYSGSLHVLRPPYLAPFRKEEAQLVEVAANQIGIAFANLLAGRSLASTQRELREMSLQTVRALVRAVEMRDRYTAGHSARVARYAVALARSLGYGENEIENLRVAALLHDVGKIGISDLLLNKAGPLTPDERARIQEHPTMGCQIVEGVQSLAASVPLIRHHQESFDGQGYPDRLAGEQIPGGARILAVADSFEAITATRAYRPGRTVAEALEILNAGSGQQWDSSLVTRWREIVGQVLTQSTPDI